MGYLSCSSLRASGGCQWRAIRRAQAIGESSSCLVDQVDGSRLAARAFADSALSIVAK